jgi:hypothetical protein
MGTPRKVRKEFSADQFTATEWDTADDKAAGMEQLARFVEAGFPRRAFTKALYRNLNLHLFHHIAHFDLNGFYQTWFSTLGRQADWIAHASAARAYGDPAYTWCDAEAAFQSWLADGDFQARFDGAADAAREAAERALLAQLLAKYPVGADAAAEAA